MPSTGAPFSIRAMLTVKSGRRLMNSLVPSSGSTRMKARPFDGGDPSRGNRFFRDDGNVRESGGQLVENDRLGAFVRLGHRRLVGLVAGVRAGFVDVHDGASGKQRRLFKYVEHGVHRRQSSLQRFPMPRLTPIGESCLTHLALWPATGPDIQKPAGAAQYFEAYQAEGLGQPDEKLAHRRLAGRRRHPHRRRFPMTVRPVISDRRHVVGRPPGQPERFAGQGRSARSSPTDRSGTFPAGCDNRHRAPHR